MKKLVALVFGLVLILALFSMAICAQQTNPQTSFPATVTAANPSLYLNFNDLTTGFVDKVSGNAFSGSATVSAGTMPVYSGAAAEQAVFNSAPLPGGSLASVTINLRTAPASSYTLDLIVGTISGTSITITNVIPVTVAATSGNQTFYAGTNYSAVTVAAGQLLGWWGNSPSGLYYGTLSGGTAYYFAGSLPAAGTPETYLTSPGYAYPITSTVTITSGTVTPRQAGFDSTTPNNTSAAFPYNGFNAAPNNTLGAIDWSTPFSLLLHVDRLNWNRTGSLVLASKGDSGSTAGGWWKLYLQMSGTSSQLCFERNGFGVNTGSPGGGLVQNGICTGALDAIPNGFNYDIVITDNGTGASGYEGSTGSLSLYVNGLGGSGSGASMPVTPFSNEYAVGFGGVAVTVGGSGTGYANPTYFTSTGGGPNCTVAGYFASSGGVPTSGLVSTYTANHGCTSLPTIALTSPTGTGATVTATALSGASMNSTTYPLLVPGYVSGGVYYGVAGGNSAAGTTYVDEAAVFPGVLTATQIGALFYQTKFYQGLLGTRPAMPPAVVFDDDGCGDMDDLWALQEAIALHKLGYLNLEGTVQEINAAGEAAFFRQQLDQAGLANVPVGIPSDSASTGSSCNATGINTFNASTLTSVTYPTASQVYRTVFAASSGAPVSIMIGGELNGLANFMQSAADSTSSLTGAQLFARNAANGGVLYSQGGICTASALPSTTPCTGNIGAQVGSTTAYADAAYVYANGRAMQMIAVDGTPAAAGPGPMATRTSKDPAYLQMLLLYGSDQRNAWDSLPLSALVTPYFYGGVTVGYAGGTGYAASTLFTSTGGGPNCTVTGYMTASGGVPNGITTLWGAAVPLEDAAGVVAGVGYGCTSAPTLTLVAPAGTGVTLTAYATKVCGTASFPGYATQSFASGTCSNQYIAAQSQWSIPESNAPVYRWFLNALVDPPPGGAPRLK